MSINGAVGGVVIHVPSEIHPYRYEKDEGLEKVHVNSVDSLGDQYQLAAGAWRLVPV